MSSTGPFAHFNAARLLHPPGDPRVAEFVDNIAKVNSIAERSKGFLWRLADEASSVAEAGYQGKSGDPHIVFSLSAWQTIADFESFVHKTVHGIFFRRRQHWFAPWQGPNYVLWPLAAPTPIAVEQGWARLQHLADHGNTAHAFDLAFAKANHSGS